MDDMPVPGFLSNMGSLKLLADHQNIQSLGIKEIKIVSCEKNACCW